MAYLVLQSAHEKLFSFLDDTTGSKVLVSSRDRGLLENADVIDVGLPTEDEAVQILLAVAGLPLDDAAAPAHGHVGRRSHRERRRDPRRVRPRGPD